MSVESIEKYPGLKVDVLKYFQLKSISEKKFKSKIDKIPKTDMKYKNMMKMDLGRKMLAEMEKRLIDIWKNKDEIFVGKLIKIF